jgi:hypothetical protein
MLRRLRSSNRIWCLAVAWALVIFLTSSTFIERQVFINFIKQFIPEGMPRHLWIGFWSGFGIFVIKAYHVAEYALLTYLLFLVFVNRVSKNYRQALIICAIISLLYAVSDEWHQTFIPGRGGTWVDVVIDCGGISLTIAFIMRKTKRQSQIQQINQV